MSIDASSLWVRTDDILPFMLAFTKALICGTSARPISQGTTVLSWSQRRACCVTSHDTVAEARPRSQKKIHKQ